MNHYARRRQAPTALGPEDQARLLDVVGAHRTAARDHALIVLALGTGLREHELAALDVSDVRELRPRGHGRGRTIRRRIRLRVYKGHKGVRVRRREVVVVPDDVRRVLERYLVWRKSLVTPNDFIERGPLFPSRLGWRLSTRQIRTLWRRWQLEAGLEPLPFHTTRHTFVTNLLAAGARPDVVQRLARHASLETTAIYAHPTESDLILAANIPARAHRTR